MSMIRALLTISLFSVFATVVSAQRFSAPVHNVWVDRSFSRKPIPKWENGFFLAYDNDQAPSTVFAFDRMGKLVRHVKISFPESAEVFVAGVAAASDGTLAVSGGAYSNAGAFAPFIALIGPLGGMEHVVRTSPFAPMRLCFADDGTLWAAGRELNPDSRGEPRHNVLRRYDRTGRLLQSLLSRESFGQSVHPHPASMAFLAASGDRVGLYSQTAKEWVEVSLSGTVLGRWRGLDLRGTFKVTGIALNSTGTVYVSIQRQDSISRARAEFFKLEKQVGSWTAMDAKNVFEGGQASGAIYGSDGEFLIISRQLPNFLWVRVE